MTSPVGGFAPLDGGQLSWAAATVNAVRADAIAVGGGGTLGPAQVDALLHEASWATLVWQAEPGVDPTALVRVYDFDPFRRVAWLQVLPGPSHGLGEPLPDGLCETLRRELRRRIPARRLLLRAPGTEAARRLHRGLTDDAVQVGYLDAHRMFDGAWCAEEIFCVDLGAPGTARAAWSEGPKPMLRPEPRDDQELGPSSLLPSGAQEVGPDGSSFAGRHTRLVPLSSHNVEEFYGWVAADPDLRSLLFQQRLPLPESFLADVERSTFQTFLVQETDQGRYVGVVAMQGLDRVHAHAWLHVYLLPDVRRRGWPIEAVLLAISWSFERLRLEKVYLELDRDGSDPVIAALARTITLEARYPQYGDHLGQAVDRFVFAVRRPDANDAAAALGTAGRSW